MKLYYKDAIGFSCLVLITIIGGLYLLDNQSTIIEIYKNTDNIDPDELQKLLDLKSFESTFVIVGMIIFMICVIAMITTFSRNPMLSNIKNIQNATRKISEGDFDTRISIVGGKDEVTELCLSINDMGDQLSDLREKLLNEVTSSKTISDNLDVQLLKQKNLQKALDESSDVSITDKDGIITYVNDTFCKLSQYSREEILGNTHNILKSGNHPEIFYKNMWDSILAGKIWHDRLQNKKKDGTIYWVDMFIVPFLDKDGKIQEFISIRRDITERMSLHSEKLKNERMVTLGTFTSRLAHDLRNPLAIIQISLENMKELYGTDEIKQNHFDKINRSIDRITHQVDDVLNYVKGDPAVLASVRFSEVLNDAIDSLNIPDRIKLILPKNKVTLICDRQQFAIAINNLILNSIQSITDQGEIEITIEENLTELIIQIKDTGKGISSDILDKVFEPLFTTKQAGTGLGLISVKSIIELHGGFISVTSPPTIFTITLPKISD